MKKLLLASAVAALSVSAAQAAPTVYGKIFLTADYNSMSNEKEVKVRDAGDKPWTVSDADSKPSDSSSTALNNNGSRVGLKGSEPLMAGTNLEYKLEYAVNVDDDSKGQFTPRDSYIALANDAMGTFSFGRFGTVEPDYANVLTGGVLGGDGVLASYDGKRTGNNFKYEAPAIMPGMSFAATYALPDSDKDDGKADGHSGNGINGQDGVASLAATYEPSNAPFRAGASIVSNLDDINAYRITGAFDVSPQITVGGLYQMIDYDTDDNENAFSVSGTYGLSPMMTAYAQADMAQNIDGVDKVDSERYAVGATYKFNKNTKGHLYGAFLNSNSESTGEIETDEKGNKWALEHTAIESSGFGIGAGIEYKF